MGITTAFTMLEYNAVGIKAAQAALHFQGDQSIRVLIALKKMNDTYVEKTGKPYDCISVHELDYKTLQLLEPFLKNTYGYRMLFGDPLYWQLLKNKNLYKCLTVVFLRDTIPYAQTSANYFSTVLRYCWIQIPVRELSITIRTSHIPCVDDTRAQHINKQLNRKRNMLQAEISFQKEFRNQLAISSGDFNGSAEDECYYQELYKEFVFKDLINEPTFGDKHLDHVYISDFSHSDLRIKAKVLDAQYMQTTDHKMIEICIC